MFYQVEYPIDPMDARKTLQAREHFNGLDVKKNA
jgi:hypothetical protein